jgi:hypothetical protein
MTYSEEIQHCTSEAHRLAAERAGTMTEDQAKAYAYGYLYDYYLTMLQNEIRRIHESHHPH